MMASSHPPVAKEPPSLCPSPQRHTFLSPLPPFCSAGASVSSSAASFCNCHQVDTDVFCVRSIDTSTQHWRARDPPSLCSSHLCHAFPSPLPRLCSTGTSVSSTELQQSHQADIDVLRAIDSPPRNITEQETHCLFALASSATMI